MKLLCGGLRPALSGFAASGRRCRYFVTAPLPPRPLACSSFACAHSVACFRAWPQGAKSRHYVGRPAPCVAPASLLWAWNARTRGRSLPIAAYPPPAVRRRLKPPLGAGLRTDRAQSVAECGRGFAVVGRGFPEPPPPLLRQGLALTSRGGFSLLCMPPISASPSFLGFVNALGSVSLFGFLLVPPPIGAGSVVARCPFRAPAPSVLLGAPSRTRLKALRFAGRGVGAYAPVFFIGWRTNLRAAFIMVSP